MLHHLSTCRHAGLAAALRKPLHVSRRATPTGTLAPRSPLHPARAKPASTGRARTNPASPSPPRAKPASISAIAALRAAPCIGSPLAKPVSNLLQTMRAADVAARHARLVEVAMPPRPCHRHAATPPNTPPRLPSLHSHRRLLLSRSRAIAPPPVHHSAGTAAAVCEARALPLLRYRCAAAATGVAAAVAASQRRSTALTDSPRGAPAKSRL